MPLLLLALASAPALVAADSLTMYRFQEEDGTVWLTDHRPRGADFDRFEFLGYHGRPPATASCRGVTPQIMATRAAAYRHDIERLADLHDVSPQLVRAIISVESCFDRLARSVAGAEGLMQLMPQTARALGVSDAFDPQQNLRGGIRYFSRLRQRYGDDLRLALAAYNAGPAAVDRFNGVPPFRETRNYVRKVMQRLRDYADE